MSESDGMDMDVVRQAFLAESEEGLGAMEEALVALEARPDDGAPLQEVFRIVHTIKGNAGIVGFANVGEFAHLLEDALEHFRSGAAAVTSTHVTVLLQTVDALRGIMRAAANNACHAGLPSADGASQQRRRASCWCWSHGLAQDA